MPTFETNAEYGLFEPRWRLINDLVSGDIKRPEVFIRYITPPEYTGSSQAMKKQLGFIQRARLLNVSKRTLLTMRGMVADAKSKAVLKLPTSSEYLSWNCDGSGTSIEQSYLDAVYSVSKLGRYGIWVDAPAEAASRADLLAGRGGARLLPFKATEILDWNERVINGRRILSYVSLLEEWDNDESYTLRILRLDEDGIYSVETKTVEKNENGSLIESYSTVTPSVGGSPLREIPFYFIGAINNRPEVDSSPIESLVDINLGHLLNSAETEEAAFYLAPTGFVNIGNLSVDEYKEANPNGITLGAAQVGILGDGGSFSYIQPNPSPMSRELMADKERQMAYIGGQMIGVYTPETAEAARIQKKGDTASLTTTVSNVEKAYQQAISMALMWNGDSDEFVFTMPRDFISETIVSDAALATIVNGTLSGVISQDTLNRTLEIKYPDIDVEGENLIGNEP